MAKIRLYTNYQYINPVSENRWVTRAATYSKIDGDDLLDYAEMNSGINRGQLAASMHAILQNFRNFLLNGHSVELPEVGTFRFSISATAEETEDQAGAEAVYCRRVLFRPSTKLKTDLNSVSLSLISSDSDDEDDEDEDYTDAEDDE